MVRELEQRLSNSSNLTPEERLQSNYLRNLQQNTLQNAENSYKDKYGKLKEDSPNKGKGISGGVIALIIVGGVVVIGIIGYLIFRSKKKK